MTAIAYALQLLGALPDLIGAGMDVLSTIKDGQHKLQEFADQGRDPTAAEWDELNARIKDLRDQLHAP